MPVKVKCSGCQKVLTAPDKARGKAVRCPKCETVIKIPAGDAKSKAVAQRQESLAATGPAVDEDFFANLDLNKVQDARVRVCPKCGTEAEPEDIECQNCGVDLDTGVLSERQRRIRSRKGPDPAKFYKEVWSDSWNFLKKNKNLAVRTGTYWTLFGTLFFCCLLMVFWCERIPPKAFWGFVTFLMLIGSPGWLWHLAIETIRATMAKKNRLKDLHFDFLLNVALGFKGLIWPYVVWMPVFLALSLPIALLILGGSLAHLGPTTTGIILGSLYAAPYFLLPIALVHMTMPYTYKAWLPWELLRIFGKNAMAAIYLLVIGTVVSLPFLAIVGGVLAAGGTSVLNSLVSAETSVVNSLLGLLGESPNPTDPGFMQTLVMAAVRVLGIALLVAPAAFLLAFPAVFVSRATGLFAYYNSETLDLMRTAPGGKPCGFGPRYLAYVVDWFIVTTLCGLMWGIWALVTFGAFHFKMPGIGALFLAGGLWLIPLLNSAFIYLYFVRAERAEGRGSTLGKYALGIVVTDMNRELISNKASNARFFAKRLTDLTFGLGHLLAIVTPKKQALHDILVGTQVLWKGEEPTAK